ncbi:MAG: putative 2-aminoethylphosphonate ABC transporter ATP-binding protein [Beijerinckiaceae bacterium]|nr:putative 2-aminoethylphosphonate ABC transporter ATP-binding protein [Beijerinckiaceae bacterium]
MPNHAAMTSEAPRAPERSFLSIRSLTKSFGQFQALKSIDLEIREGEFVCFLGPSGCGKTTLLRAIAGLDRQSSGNISLRGKDVSNAPPSARDFGIVFQSYALFPNLTVADNVGYGLVNQKKPREVIAARISELLALVGLPDQAGKYPAQLSGGQQQRVALARALATSPGLLLLDEPLSALDARVRLRLREEIRALQRRLGVTTIMVTHDQEEALSMAERIVVMNHGVIEQVGTPEEVYARPKTAFVADFVGRMTFLSGVREGQALVRVGDQALRVADAPGFAPGEKVEIGLRPEAVRFTESAAGENRLAMRITDLEYLGSFVRAKLQGEGASPLILLADLPFNVMQDRAYEPGQAVIAELPASALRIFPARPFFPARP